MKMVKAIIGLLALTNAWLLLTSSVYAQEMSNNDYILKIKPTQNATSSSTEANKTHNNEAENKTQIPELQFSLSDTLIDFGDLKSGEPILRTMDINISSSTGSQVLIYENSPLRAEDKSEIPDTTCDEGVCTEFRAATWINPLTYGYGFRCKNVQNSPCSNQFRKENTFMQFSNISLQEDVISVIKASNQNLFQAEISLKVNITSADSDKSFSNEIYVIALPQLTSY